MTFKKIAFLAPLFAGVVFAILLTTPLFRISGTSVRQETIINALQQDSVYGVMLGNSLVMNGVDTSVIEKELAVDGRFYNLSSGGQTGLESMLIMDNMKKEVSAIGFGFSIDLSIDIPENVISKYFNAGFAFSEGMNTLAQKTKAQSYLTFYNKNALQKIYSSRWFVETSINDFARKLLRRDLDLEKENTDLFHPSPYNVKISEEKTAAIIKRIFPKPPVFYLTGFQKELLKHFEMESKKRGAFYFLVIMPINPKILAHADIKSLRSSVDQLKSLLGEEHVLDLSSLLEHELFIDHCHATGAGAERISHKIADYLKSNNPTGDQNAL